MTLKDYCTGGEHELVPGRLRLYRTWGVDREEQAPQLRSTNFHRVWEQEMRAECLRRECDHDRSVAPVASCTCGIYGWYEPHDTSVVFAPVIGVIEAWGHCVLGSNGARVQNAQLIAVAPNPRADTSVRGAQWLRQALAQESRRGTKIYWTFAELLQDFPPISVRELAGEPVRIADPTIRVTTDNLGRAVAQGLIAGLTEARHARPVGWGTRIVRWLFSPYADLLASAMAAGRRRA